MSRVLATVIIPPSSIPTEVQVVESDPVRRMVPSPAALAAMSAADRALEREIAFTRQRMRAARTSFGRRLTISQLKLLEGRRSPEALRAIALHRTPW